MLVSVIVPIYNTEKYLNQCIDSILDQTYKKLEVILVDDGSKDKCVTICDTYAKKDCRVKVIHKANGGAASAREAGMAIATGDYVMFVDGDDWIDTNTIELCIDKIEKNKSIDCVMFSYIKETEGLKCREDLGGA